MRRPFALGTAMFSSLALIWACSSSPITSQPAVDASITEGGSTSGSSSSGSDATVDLDGTTFADASDASPDAWSSDAANDTGSDAAGDAGTDAPPPVDAAPDAPAPTPAVRYVGRFETTDANGPRAAWPASRAIVRFNGTALDANLAHANGFSGGPTYLDVIVDGVVQNAPISVPVGVNVVSVASGLAAGDHVVELVKRTEAQHGVVQFRGFSYPGGGTLLAPSPAKTRRIEVIGNSAITGYGVDGAGPNCAGGATAMTFNARKSGAQVAANQVGADLVFVGYAGKGVTKNITPGDNDTFPVLFGRTLPESGGFAWNFAAYVPDAVIVVITNIDAENTEPGITNAYEAFAIQIRGAYPNAHIVLAVSAAATDDYPVGQMTRTRLKAMGASVVSKRKGAGDQNISTFAMTEYTNGQLSGCDYHPNEALHTQMGTEMANWLKTQLGW